MSPFPALVLTAAALLLPAETVTAQRPVRGVMPKAIADELPVAPGQDRVVVKLAERRPGVAGGGRILAADVLDVIASRPVRPLFAGMERQLADIRVRQLAAAPAGGHPAVDLALYFEVLALNAEDARLLVRALNALAAVELAYPRELPAPPPGDIPPTTPDFTVGQGYRAPAPNGIDGDAILSTAGGTGAGVTVLDVEYGWELQHEDLSRLRPTSVVGNPFPANGTHNDHGTAVAGIISADADIYGVTGFNPDVTYVVSSTLLPFGFSVAGAIANGMASLTAGDVIVLETQTYTPLGLGPSEWNQAEFDAILIATGLGITTVAAAGNGSVDLDSPALGGLFQTSVRDSGAIIVGATGGSPLARASFSTYGSRVDANGWGSYVTTTGYGTFWDPGDVRQRYTSGFGGTSAATAIVAGAVIALRGAAVARLDPAQAAALDAFAIRSLLRSTGNPAVLIGNRPDCAALFAAAGITTGLAVRNEPRVGQPVHVDLAPSFSPAAQDLWAFAGSFVPANQPLPVLAAGRLLLGAPVTPLGFGSFAGPAATLSWSIPNTAAARGLRYFVQAVTYESASQRLAATNAVLLLVRR